MNEKEVIKLAIDICEALEICHKQKIIHRDLKIDNIFISSNNSFKLGDFGVARNVEKTLSGLSKKCTYTYMAPEVYKGDDYNSNIDLYSLGIVMYKLLNNNREPFLPSYPNLIKYSDRNNALVRRMKGETILPPKNASREISDIILKACSYNSTSRYQHPSEMKADLMAVYNLKDNTEDKVEEIITITPPEAESMELNETERTVCLFASDEKKAHNEQEQQTDIPQQSEMPKPAEKTYPAYYKTDYQNAIRKIEQPQNKEESFQGVQVLKTIADEGYPPAISYLKYNSDTIQLIIEKFEPTFKDNKKTETADDTSDYDKKIKIIVRSVAIILSFFVLMSILVSILQISKSKNNDEISDNLEGLTFQVGDDVYSWPYSYKDFLDDGWEISECSDCIDRNDIDNSIVSNSEVAGWAGISLVKKEEEIRINFWNVNTNVSNDRKVKDCYVLYEFTDCNAVFMDSIDSESSKEEILEAYGTPDRIVSDDYPLEFLYYDYQYYDYTITLEFIFNNNKGGSIIEVSVDNNQE